MPPPVGRRQRLLPRDRLMGGLVGLIIGDALGVPVEFSSRQERDQDPLQGMRGFGTHHQPAGTWSDDGALAMAHAAAFIAHGWNPEQHLRAFLAWLEDGHFTAHNNVFDIGLATRRALQRFRNGRPLTEIGGDRNVDNGNGSLMRILPASCWWAGSPPSELIANLGEASALTHAHVRSRLCCALHGLIADRLLSRVPMEYALKESAVLIAPCIPTEERAVFASLLDGSCLTWSRNAIPSDGHVVSTLIAACWCLHHHADFADAVLAAVNLGEDTDTTAAVTGGLAGLRCGFSGLPVAWTTCLPRRVEVIDLAERFSDACVQKHLVR